MSGPASAAGERVTAAKLWLVSDPPPGATPGAEPPAGLAYLATALFAMVFVSCDEVATFSVDEHWRLYGNPEWLVATEVPGVARELAHQAWHLLADHAARARDLRVDATTAESWTSATDVTVSATLEANQLRPGRLVTSAGLGLPDGRSAEEYFALLSGLPAGTEGGEGGQPLSAEGCGSGCDGLPRPHELPPDADLGAVDGEAARELRRRVAIDYREHATSRGEQPGDAWRWAVGLLEPTIAWEPLLTGAVRRAVGWVSGRTRPTYTRPSRRASTCPGIVLPGMRRPVPKVAVVVDTSGSVDDALLGRAMGEVDGALRSLGVPGEGVTVLSCDAAVHTTTRARRARDARLGGGGGTDMRVGLAAAERLRPRADLVVVFTDGYTPWPPEAPTGSLVVIALLGRSRSALPPTPAWATRVECLLD